MNAFKFRTQPYSSQWLPDKFSKSSIPILQWMAGLCPWESRPGGKIWAEKSRREEHLTLLREPESFFRSVVWLPIPAVPGTPRLQGLPLPQDRVIETIQSEFPQPSIGRGKQFTIGKPNISRGRFTIVNGRQKTEV